MPKPEYGVDAPKLVRRFAVRSLLLIAFAVFLYIVNRSTAPAAAKTLAGLLLAVGLTFGCIAAFMLYSSLVTKRKVIERILDSIPWRGNESVLDVGCGRGMFLISAAKRLKSGKATGVDIWRSEDLSGNSAEATLSNAKAEGVGNRIKIENADARQLPFGAGSFDVVVSSLAIHNIEGSGERAKALREIARVLKPGGYLAIFDILHTQEYAKVLEQLDFNDIHVSPLTFLWCVPTRTLTARKAS